MGHGEHVDVEAPRDCEQPRVRRGAGVAGQQHAATGTVDAQDQRRLVGLPVEPGVRTTRVRREHLDAQRADVGDRPGGRTLQHAARGVRRGESLGEQRRGQLPGRCPPQRVGVRDGQDVRQATGVVEVRVGHDHQVELAHARAAQPGRRSTVVAPGVDQHADVARGQQERVTLADVERGEGEAVPVRTAASRGQRQRQHGGDRRHRDPRGAPPRPGQQPRRRGAGHDDARGRRGGHDRPPPAQPVRGGEHDADGPAGDPQQHLGERRQRHNDQRCRGGEHTRQRGRGNGDEVGRHGGECDVLADRDQQRPHGQLRTHPDGQQVAQRHRRATEQRQRVDAPPHDRRCQQHPGGRGGGQQQPEPTGEQGVGQHEQQDGAAEHVDGVDPATAAGGQQRDQCGGPGPQHRRVGPGEDHEREHRARHDTPPAPCPEAAQHGQPERARHHQRDVRAADRDQVRQARGEHGVLVPGRQAGGLAGDQAGGDRCAGRRQDAVRGGAQVRTQDRGCVHRTRGVGRVDEPGVVQYRGDVAPGAPRPVRGPDLDRTREPGAQRRSPLEQHLGTLADHPPVEPLDPDVGAPAPPGDLLRLTDDEQHGVPGDRGTPHLRERPFGEGVQPDPGHGEDDQGHRDGPGHGPRTPPA